jgi:type I restriction enzyme S subunit
VADLISGAGFPLSEQGAQDLELPFFKVGDLGSTSVGSPLISARHTVDRPTAARLQAKIIPPGSVVFAKIGMAISLNRRRLIGQPSCIDNNMMAAVPDPAVISGAYLLRILESIDFMPLAHSTTVPALRKSDLMRIPVLVPTLEQQAKVVNLLANSDRLSQLAAGHTDRAQRLLQRFQNAIIEDACSGVLTEEWREERQLPVPDIPSAPRPTKLLQPLDHYELPTIPDSWRWSQVVDLVVPGGIFDGPFGSNLKTADYTTAGARVIRLENIGRLTFIDDKRTFVTRDKYQRLQRHAVHPTDVVCASFVEGHIRVCVLPESLEEESLAKADCFTLRPLTTIDSRYLALQLASARSYEFLASDVHGATRPRINLRQLKSLPIPVCPVEEQRLIADMVDKRLQASASVSARIDSGCRDLRLIARAFLDSAIHELSREIDNKQEDIL